MGKITITEKQEAIIRRLNDPLYTVEFLKEWVNRNDNVFINAPAALQAMGASGFFAAVRAIERAKEATVKIMNYRPKVVRCRLKTGGKSIPQIREECRGQGLTYRDFENIQRSNEEFDGLVVLLSLWAYDNHASYHLHNWDPADDERMMMAIYYAEQVHPFPRYKNDLAKFKADWAAQAYDPGGASLTFAPADVEELEVLCEEATEPEPPAPPAPKRKKHKRRRK